MNAGTPPNPVAGGPVFPGSSAASIHRLAAVKQIPRSIQALSETISESNGRLSTMCDAVETRERWKIISG